MKIQLIDLQTRFGISDTLAAEVQTITKVRQKIKAKIENRKSKIENRKSPHHFGVTLVVILNGLHFSY